MSRLDANIVIDTRFFGSANGLRRQEASARCVVASFAKNALARDAIPSKRSSSAGLIKNIFVRELRSGNLSLVPQPLPWTVTAGREVGDSSGNVVQYTIANLGLICLAVNSHDRLINTLSQVETWLRSKATSQLAGAPAILELVSAATGRLGYGVLAAKIEDAEVASPEFDRALAVELQIPEALYTSSIDAALSLVPKSWGFSVTNKEQLNPLTNSPAVYTVVELRADGKLATATSLSLPIAICAAALKAREL